MEKPLKKIISLSLLLLVLTGCRSTPEQGKTTESLPNYELYEESAQPSIIIPDSETSTMEIITPETSQSSDSN